MSRALFLLLLLAAQSPAAAQPAVPKLSGRGAADQPADLPPGAVARLGDGRFRAGGPVSHLALSPDGKRFATVRWGEIGIVALTVWDAAGRPLHEQRVSSKLFRGLVWGKNGAFAVARGAEMDASGKFARVVAHDFRVWDFTDPDAAPPLPPSVHDSQKIHDVVAQYDTEYSDFQFSADGSRVAALWCDKGKHAVHVFELKPAPAAAKLARAGTLDLGAEGAGAVRISADGRTVVTFRRLIESDSPPGADFAATVWDADAGTPSKPVRVSGAAGAAPRLGRGERDRITHRLMLSPDAKGVVMHFAGESDWGFDRCDIGPPVKRRGLLRLPYGAADNPHRRPGVEDSGEYAFFPTGDTLVIATDRRAVIFDAFAGKSLGRLEGHAHELTAVAVSAGGGTVATADLFGLVRLWDAKTFRPKAAPTGHTSPVQWAELSPDGKRLLTWAADETVRLWDVATGKELRAFAGVPAFRDERIARPAFTPDGTAVLFSTAERLVCRDLATTLEVPLPGALAKLGPRSVEFSPGGKTLLTRGPDDEREAWDWATGAPAAAVSPALPRLSANSEYMGARVSLHADAVRLKESVSEGTRRVLTTGHRGRMAVLGFTPDGSRLLTAGDDHTVLVWDTRLQSVPLPDALKAETSAAKLWAAMAGDDASAAYLAMARLAREPAAAVKLATLKLKPATPDDADTDESRLLDARAIELLEALDSDAARALLKELAGGKATAFRTIWAERAWERGNGR